MITGEQHMVTRRTVLQGIGAAGLAAAADAVPRSAVAVGGGVTEPLFTFASLPDFFNGDVADLSHLPSWDGGMNSVNASWRDAIDHCLDAVSAHHPDAVFVAGDAVEGHWNIDSDGRALFGPVSQGTDPESLAQCRDAVQTAGDVHYSFYGDLFSSRGLDMYPTVGDHELLDDRPGPLNDRWSPTGFNHNGTPDNRYHLVEHCKDVWAGHFTRPGGTPRFSRRPVGTQAEWTAYSRSFAGAVTLITVDMFHLQSNGVRLGVFGGQLEWLRREIRRAKRHGHIVIVQGHIPTTVPTRWLHSGRLQVPEQRSSTFYRTLEREGVDLYLCGEVHDVTVRQHGAGAPVQISHGCIFRYGFNYLIGRVFPGGRVVVDLYEIPLLRASLATEIWSCDATRRQRTYLEYGEPAHHGRLVQRDRVVSRRTQKLGVYDPQNDPWSLAEHSVTVLF
jgi:3',5'-cyclic AMP phosphodiesterase CpdA